MLDLSDARDSLSGYDLVSGSFELQPVVPQLRTYHFEGRVGVLVWSLRTISILVSSTGTWATVCRPSPHGHFVPIQLSRAAAVQTYYHSRSYRRGLIAPLNADGETNQ